MEITGKVLQDTFKDTTNQVQEDEPTEPYRNVNQILVVSTLISRFRNLTYVTVTITIEMQRRYCR